MKDKIIFAIVIAMVVTVIYVAGYRAAEIKYTRKLTNSTTTSYYAN